MSKQDNKMDPKVKKKWLKELRSGNYNQGKSSLCKIGEDGTASYCCLGVLAEVLGGEDIWRKSSTSRLKIKGSAELVGYLSETLLRKAGLNGLTINGPDQDASLELASLNDGGKTLKQIANIIEKDL